MPLLRMDGSTGNPDWLAWSGFGYAHFTKGEKPTLELHYHDADEYWICTKGRLKVKSEDIVYEMTEGDLLVTRAGDEHTIVEICEDSSVIWIEDAIKPGGKPGHLHRS